MRKFVKNLLALVVLMCSSYSYAQSLDCTSVLVNVSSGSQDNAIGWNISGGNSGWPQASGGVGTISDCILDGCYVFNMYASDGWGGSELTLTVNQEVVYVGTLEEGSYAGVDFQIGTSIPCEDPCALVDCLEGYECINGDCFEMISYGCEYEGELYSFGSSIDQECNTCSCQAGFNPNANGFWMCTEIACGCTDDQGGFYSEGEYWSIDDCTDCFCEAGEVVCMAMSCPEPECENPIYVEGECCAVCVEEPNCQDISITLSAGWNMIGFACAENTDAIASFASILDKIIIVKDGAGLAYLPEWEFNGIGNLERGYGYLLKVSEEIPEFNICE
tara:strand:- start:1155 stop:2150 length:996 start_codon:yes stop_codon:yes gene_type:complete